MKPALVLSLAALTACAKAGADDGSSRPYKVGVVDRGEVRVTVEETGVVEPERSIVVKSPISGVVQQLYVREGDRVQPGQGLARILPDIAQANSLAQLRSEIARAQIARDNARRDFDRAQSLASIDRLKKIAANAKATVIIQHDARDIDKLPAFPAAAK